MACTRQMSYHMSQLRYQCDMPLQKLSGVAILVACVADELNPGIARLYRGSVGLQRRLPFWCPYRNVGFPEYNLTQGNQLCKVTGQN